jgi:hypothetical protein
VHEEVLVRDVRRPDLRDLVADPDEHDARGEAIAELVEHHAVA